MAHETLKATIRQYIGPNGQNSITGQIMQDILIAMVDEYPNLSGYATQSWVNTQLGDYLPLTGGTLSGNLTVLNASMSVVTAGSSATSYTATITGSGIEAQMLRSGTPINNRMVLNYNGLTFYDQNVAGTTITLSSITSGSFIKSGGTSSQFLKADGSVDSNTYITASALNGYATQSWVTTQLGDYLPLAGGTITGNLTVNDTVKFNNNLTFAYDRGIKFGTDNKVKITRDSSKLLIVDEAGGDIIIGDYDNTAYTSIINDLHGCPSNSAYILGNPTWFILNDGTAQFKTVSQTSDLRKKTITGDVPMDLDNVANAPLFKFTWKGQKNNSSQHIGTSAQYWQNILPELVSVGRDADMTLAIQYDVIALASAITVAKTVVDHEARIRQLEEKIK